MSRLKEKNNIVDKEKPFKCSFCSRKFETRLELTTHKKERHGVV